MQAFIFALASCSLSMTAVALVFAALRKPLSRRCGAGWLAAIWQIITLAFIVPWRPEIVLPNPGVHVPEVLEQGAAHTFNVYFEAPLSSTAGQQEVWQVPVFEILFAAWLAGAVFSLLLGIVRHRRFMKTAIRWSADANGLSDVLTKVKAELNIKKDIGIKVSHTVTVPMLAGFFKPMVLLPEKMLNSPQIELIIRHELVHYKRRDLWAKMFMLLATSIHWFNPAVYLVVKASSLQCELACDERVMEYSGTAQKESYATAILSAACAPAKPVLATNLYGGKSEMKARIASIMSAGKKGRAVASLLIVLLLTLSTGVVFAREITPERITKNNNAPVLASVDSTRGRQPVSEELQQAGNDSTDNYLSLLSVNGGVGEYQNTSDADNASLLENAAQDPWSDDILSELPAGELPQTKPDDTGGDDVTTPPVTPPDSGVDIYSIYSNYGITFDRQTNCIYYQGVPVRYFDADTYYYEGQTYKFIDGDTTTQERVKSIPREDWTNRMNSLSDYKTSYMPEGRVDILVLRDDKQQICGISITIYEPESSDSEEDQPNEMERQHAEAPQQVVTENEVLARQEQILPQADEQQPAEIERAEDGGDEVTEGEMPDDASSDELMAEEADGAGEQLVEGPEDEKDETLK